MLHDLLLLPWWAWWVFANQLAFGWVVLAKLPELRDPSRARALGMRIGMLVLCVAVGLLVWVAVALVDAWQAWDRARRARIAVDPGAADAVAARVLSLRRSAAPVPPGEPRP